MYASQETQKETLYAIRKNHCFSPSCFDPSPFRPLINFFHPIGL